MRFIFGPIIAGLFSLGCQSIEKISVTEQDFNKVRIPPSHMIFGEIPMIIDLKEATFYSNDSTLTMRGILRDEATKLHLKEGYVSICRDTIKDLLQQTDTTGAFSLKIKIKPNKKLMFEYPGQKPIIYDLSKLLSIVVSKSSK